MGCCLGMWLKKGIFKYCLRFECLKMLPTLELRSSSIKTTLKTALGFNSMQHAIFVQPRWKAFIRLHMEWCHVCWLRHAIYTVILDTDWSAEQLFDSQWNTSFVVIECFFQCILEHVLKMFHLNGFIMVTVHQSVFPLLLSSYCCCVRLIWMLKSHGKTLKRHRVTVLQRVGQRFFCLKSLKRRVIMQFKGCLARLWVCFFCHVSRDFLNWVCFSIDIQ